MELQLAGNQNKTNEIDAPATEEEQEQILGVHRPSFQTGFTSSVGNSLLNS